MMWVVKRAVTEFWLQNSELSLEFLWYTDLFFFLSICWETKPHSLSSPYWRASGVLGSQVWSGFPSLDWRFITDFQPSQSLWLLFYCEMKGLDSKLTDTSSCLHCNTEEMESVLVRVKHVFQETDVNKCTQCLRNHGHCVPVGTCSFIFGDVTSMTRDWFRCVVLVTHDMWQCYRNVISHNNE